MTEDAPFRAEQVVEGYELLFDPLMRAAHLACLQFARLTRDDKRPDVVTCLRFAELFKVPGADLAAFFGHLGFCEGGRTIWVDALCGDLPTWTAQQRATREQAIAFGFQCAFAETFAGGAAH